MASDHDSDEFELVDTLDVAQQIAAEKKPDLKKIRAWLSPTDYMAPSSEFNRHLQSQAPGTGEWIRETAQFTQWHISPTHGSIWIKAVPGAGKSVVAASMIDSLDIKESVPVLFFFFRQIIEINRTARSLTKDWLSQLLPFSLPLQLSLWELVEEEGTALDIVSDERLWKLLLSGLRAIERAYCVVDALDEMTVDVDFLDRINKLGSFKPANIKVMLTSRPKQYLQRALKDPQVIHVSLEEELVKRDISVFVHQRTSTFVSQGVDEDTRQFMETIICERSQGLFLYARLMLDQMAKLISERTLDNGKIRDAVTKLPVGLEEMYNQILHDHLTIAKVDQQTQLVLLQLVTHAAHPLRLIELAKALEIRCQISDTRSKDVVRMACGPLLEVTENEVVQVLHHSFTEFLLDADRAKRSTTECLQFPCIEPSRTHGELARLCIIVLESGIFDKFPEDDKSKDYDSSDSSGHGRAPWSNFKFQDIFMKNPLARYAVWKWPYHAKHYPIEDTAFLDFMTSFCESKSAAYRAWLTLVAKRDMASRLAGSNDAPVAGRGVTPLHVAAGFGMSLWASRLLQQGAGVDDLDCSAYSPLFWAAKGGYVEVVDLLLKAGAKPDIDGHSGLKPLHLAAQRNHAGVARLLLAAGVSSMTPKTKDPGRRCGNAPTTRGYTPLRYASMYGHADTVVELAQYTKVHDLEPVLCWAAKRGHHKVVSALLEKFDVSPNSTTKAGYVSPSGNAKEPTFGPANWTRSGRPALMLAAESLDVDAVQVLLAHGANVNQASTAEYSMNKERSGGQTALHGFAGSGLKPDAEATGQKIVDMLVSAGADLEARNDEGQTPLMITIGGRSSRDRSLTAMDCLLSVGADPCTRDDKGDTLLHHACNTLHGTEVASKLLSRKADPCLQRLSDGATPLHCATGNRAVGNGSAVEHIDLLMDHGANVNAEDSKGATPLHYTCRSTDNDEKRKAVLEALLRHGAEINHQNHVGQTCLHVFSGNYRKEESAEVIHMIFNGGINLGLQDWEGETVLMHAISANNNVLFDTLLERPDQLCLSAWAYRHGRTALHFACRSNQPAEWVKRLIDSGADPRSTDNYGNTLLHDLAWKFQGYTTEIKLIEKLVDLGVPIHAKNAQRRTAAHVVPIERSYSRPGDKSTRNTFVSVLLRLDPRLDINAPDVDGYTPLHFAAALSEVQTFTLLRAGADLTAKSHSLRTPLHCAARGRQSNIIDMLLHFAAESGQKIDVNAMDQDRKTPLLDAVRSGCIESVEILLNHGASTEGHIALAPFYFFGAGPSRRRQQSESPGPPMAACAEIPEEARIWSCVRKTALENDKVWSASRSQNFLPHYSISDDFRIFLVPQNPHLHPHSKLAQPYPVRIGAIAETLIERGANDDQIMTCALLAGSSDLVAALSQKQRGNLSGDGCHYAEASLLLPISQIGLILDQSKDAKGFQHPFDNPVQDPSDRVSEMNGAMMDALLERGTDFVKCNGTTGDYGSPISKIVALGLTDLLVKIIDKAKLLDDVEYNKEVACQSWMRPLLQAACDRPEWNMDTVKALIEQGNVDVNAYRYKKERVDYREPEKIIRSETALHVLAPGDHWWQIEALKFLIENGAQVDALDNSGQTPLSIASTRFASHLIDHKGYFRPQCCEVLLQAGANPNHVDSQGDTPLNKAEDDAEIVKILLKHGADANKGPRGAVASAVAARSVATLQIYLESGADCNVPDTSSNRHTRVRTRSDTHRYPLLIAGLPDSAREWDARVAVEMLELMLQHGARPDLAANNDVSILHYLFQHGSTDVLRVFARQDGLDFNARDRNGRTVFLAACNTDFTPKNYNMQGANGYGRLVQEDAVDTLPAYRLLVDSERYGSSIDYLAADNDGKHILMYLLPKWSTEIADRFLPIPGVRELIQKPDNAGFYPLHRALQCRKFDACTLLADEGGADLLQADPDGNTLLHYLCRHWSVYDKDRCLPLMARFLALGGSIDATNDRGETPLLAYVAANHRVTARTTSAADDLFGEGPTGEPPCFAFLLARGADVRATDHEGQGALHKVAQHDHGYHRYEIDRAERNEAAFERLVALGCDPLAEDKQGRTALDVAAAMGDQGILALYERRKES